MSKKEQEIIQKIDEKLDSKVSFDDISSNITYQPKHINWFQRNLLQIVGISLCLVICGAIISGSIIYGKLKNHGEDLLDGKYHYRDWSGEPASSSQSDYYMIPYWSDMTIIQKFPSVVLNGNTYMIWSTDQLLTVNETFIQTKLFDAEVKGFDIYTDTQYVEQVEIYSIKKVDDSAAVAVKYKDYDFYVPMCNSNCSFETVGDFVNKLNLKEYASFGNVYMDYIDSQNVYNQVIFENVNNLDIYNLFFSNENPQISKGPFAFEGHSKLFSVSFNVLQIGRKNLSLAFYDDGVVTTNLFSSGRTYSIDPQKGREFINYLNSNYIGYVYRYVDNSDHSSESTSMSTSSSSTEHNF